MFDALVDEVTRRIEATEGRERSRRQTDQRCFEHSVKVTLADLWKNEIEPVKVVAKEKVKPTGMSLYEDQRYFPKTPLPEYDLPIQQPLKDTPLDPEIFPQSEVQNNKGLNSAKGTNREEVIAS